MSWCVPRVDFIVAPARIAGLSPDETEAIERRGRASGIVACYSDPLAYLTPGERFALAWALAELSEDRLCGGSPCSAEQRKGA